MGEENFLVPMSEEELHAYQDELVRQGLEDMRDGRVVAHEEVLRKLRASGRCAC